MVTPFWKTIQFHVPFVVRRVVRGEAQTAACDRAGGGWTLSALLHVSGLAQRVYPPLLLPPLFIPLQRKRSLSKFQITCPEIKRIGANTFEFPQQTGVRAERD